MADVAATSAVGLAASAAALYSFGIAYLNEYLWKLGFDPHLFPIDFYEQVFYGGIFGAWPVYISFLSLLGGGLVAASLARLLKKFGYSKPPESAKPPGLISWFSMLIMAWAVWVFVQGINTYYARTNAEKWIQQIKDVPCRVKDRPRIGLAFEMENGERIQQPGVRVFCSERFCGFHDGTNATVVSLAGVKSIRTAEWPAGCPITRSEGAAEGRDGGAAGATTPIAPGQDIERD